MGCLAENSDSALQNHLRPLKMLMSNHHTQKNLIGPGWSPGHRLFRNSPLETYLHRFTNYLHHFMNKENKPIWIMQLWKWTTSNSSSNNCGLGTKKQTNKQTNKQTRSSHGKSSRAMPETWVRCLGWQMPEKGKANHSSHGIWSHHFMGNRWGNSGSSVRLYFGGLQNHCTWWLQPWN